MPSCRACMTARAFCFGRAAASATPAVIRVKAAPAANKLTRILFLLLRDFPAVVDHLDDAGKILAAAAAVDEALVQLLGLAAHWGIGAGGLRRVHRQLQVF